MTGNCLSAPAAATCQAQSAKPAIHASESPAAGQGAGTLHNAAVSVSGNELRKGRAQVHASSAARTAAYRANRARVDYTDTPETVAKLHDIAHALDCSSNELLRSMVRFALLNRNWRQVGLFGARKHGELL